MEKDTGNTIRLPVAAHYVYTGGVLVEQSYTYRDVPVSAIVGLLQPAYDRHCTKMEEQAGQKAGEA